MLLEELGTASKAAGMEEHEKVVFEPWLENVLTIIAGYSILSFVFGALSNRCVVLVEKTER